MTDSTQTHETPTPTIDPLAELLHAGRLLAAGAPESLDAKRWQRAAAATDGMTLITVDSFRRAVLGSLGQAMKKLVADVGADRDAVDVVMALLHQVLSPQLIAETAGQDAWTVGAYGEGFNVLISNHPVIRTAVGAICDGSIDMELLAGVATLGTGGGAA